MLSEAAKDFATQLGAIVVVREDVLKLDPPIQRVVNSHLGGGFWKQSDRIATAAKTLISLRQIALRISTHEQVTTTELDEACRAARDTVEAMLAVKDPVARLIASHTPAVVDRASRLRNFGYQSEDSQGHDWGGISAAISIMSMLDEAQMQALAEVTQSAADMKRLRDAALHGSTAAAHYRIQGFREALKPLNPENLTQLGVIEARFEEEIHSLVNRAKERLRSYEPSASREGKPSASREDYVPSKQGFSKKDARLAVAQVLHGISNPVVAAVVMTILKRKMTKVRQDQSPPRLLNDALRKALTKAIKDPLKMIPDDAEALAMLGAPTNNFSENHPAWRRIDNPVVTLLTSQPLTGLVTSQTLDSEATMRLSPETILRFEHAMAAAEALGPTAATLFAQDMLHTVSENVAHAHPIFVATLDTMPTNLITALNKTRQAGHPVEIIDHTKGGKLHPNDLLKDNPKKTATLVSILIGTDTLPWIVAARTKALENPIFLAKGIWSQLQDQLETLPQAAE